MFRHELAGGPCRPTNCNLYFRGIYRAERLDVIRAEVTNYSALSAELRPVALCTGLRA